MKSPTNATNLNGKTIGVSIPAPTQNQDEGKALIVNSSGTGLTFGEAGSVDDVVNAAGQSVVTNKIAYLPSGTVQLLNQSVTFVANTDSSTNTEFPYRASVSVTGVESSTYAEVTYSEEQATSLNFATFIETATDVIYLYSRTDVGTVTIPTISIGMDYSDITIDSSPTSGSGNAVSSGGVYTNCVRTTGNQYVGGIKTFTDSIVIEKGLPDFYMDNTSDDYTQANTSVDTKNYFAFRDKNNNATFHISEYTYNGGRAVAMTVSNKASGTTDTAEINIFNPDSGDSHATAPYRTFNSANSFDIVTIGMLNSNKIRLGGIDITKSIGSPAGDDFKVINNGSTTCAVDTIYNYGDGYGYWNTIIVGSNTQSRLVHRMNTSGSVTIYIEKWVNGTYSVHTLHSV